MQEVNAEEKVATSGAVINLPYRNASKKKDRYRLNRVWSHRCVVLRVRACQSVLFFSFSLSLSYSSERIFDAENKRCTRKTIAHGIHREICRNSTWNLHKKIVRIRYRYLFRRLALFVLPTWIILKFCYIFCELFSKFYKSEASIFFYFNMLSLHWNNFRRIENFALWKEVHYSDWLKGKFSRLLVDLLWAISPECPSVENSEFYETVIRVAEHDFADRLFLFALAAPATLSFRHKHGVIQFWSSQSRGFNGKRHCQRQNDVCGTNVSVWSYFERSWKSSYETSSWHSACIKEKRRNFNKWNDNSFISKFLASKSHRDNEFRWDAKFRFSRTHPSDFRV